MEEYKTSVMKKQFLIAAIAGVGMIAMNSCSQKITSGASSQQTAATATTSSPDNNNTTTNTSQENTEYPSVKLESGSIHNR
jgi:hypothetical protein